MLMRMADLSGKTVLITGATSGIGFEAAVELARTDAQLVIVGRNEAKTATKAEEVRRRSGSNRVEFLVCDFESQRQVRRLAEAFHARHDSLHLLVNNAGAVFAKRTLTEDGMEATFAVNHLSYFLLTHLLLDLLMKSAPARIVNVASVAHYRGTMDFDDLMFERGYRIMRAYSRSKLANVLFTRELARRLKGSGVTVNALHPGTVASNIWSGAPWPIRPVLWFAKRLMMTPAEGAKTILYLATSREVVGTTGLYFEKNRVKEPSPLARDEAVAMRLWKESERLVRITRTVTHGENIDVTTMPPP
jgi:NAD(P)-dependent dehydrogenase (short-subunit alcohol dehydrogenase family)